MSDLVKKKLCIFAMQDFANVHTKVAHAINDYSSSWEAKIICLAPHPFNYPLKHHVDISVLTPELKKETIDWIQDVDVFIFAEEAYRGSIGSFYAWVEPVLLYQNHLLTRGVWIIFHAGCPSRQDLQTYNVLDHGQFKYQLAAPDLHRLCNPNAVPLFGHPIESNVTEIEELWKNKSTDKIVVSHCPTNYALKGTVELKKIMENVQANCKVHGRSVEFRLIGGPLGTGTDMPNDVMRQKRKLESHIYIDQYYSPVGAFGQSVVESLADGVISVSTMSQISDKLWATQDIDINAGPIICLPPSDQGLDEPIRILTELCLQPLEYLQDLATQGGHWINKYFGYKPFVDRYEKTVLNLCLEKKPFENK